MALKTAWEDSAKGLIFPDAYHRVAGIVLALDDDDPKAEITLAIYVDEAARQAGKVPFATRAIAVPNVKAEDSEVGEKDSFTKRMADNALKASGKSPIKAAYEYLKLHPLYKTATGV